MKVLVCGGRDYGDRAHLTQVLDKVHRHRGITILIQGGAKGADLMAAQWARVRHIPVKEYPAQWEKYGKSAGYRRNRQMLQEEQPHVVIAFPGGKGTDNMVELATKAGVKVYRA